MTTKTKRKSTPRISSRADFIARHASVILNLTPESELDSYDEIQEKRKDNEAAIKEFLEEFINRLLPRDGGLVLAVFESCNI